ncbi:LytTR family DNA-binding domain-containing protein [Pedobacter heparinus]|uniref:LytR/AlgR family response regulator transcription factor n=1 Tax=Pedobacter heparinus TaxID=984 RepID=UPI00292EB010|nr:LytTR family DNA-binding domain-containing protein [Pedobacter heparinus]
MGLLDQQIVLPFSTKRVTIKHIMLHAGYWILITAFFCYEKRYLIYKAGLPYFILCVTGRITMLVGVAYINLHYLLPRYLAKGTYLRYFLLVLLSVLGYLTLQSIFDFILYGFIIGPTLNSNLLEAILYNLFSTIWYLAIMVGLKLSIDWFELQRTPIPVQTNETAPDFLFVKSGTQKIRLSLEEVTHIEGLKDYTIVHTAERRIITKGSVKHMTELFTEPNFIRVHKSFIVARNKISQIEKNKILIAGHQIPIGRVYRSGLGKIF